MNKLYPIISVTSASTANISVLTSDSFSIFVDGGNSNRLSIKDYSGTTNVFTYTSDPVNITQSNLTVGGLVVTGNTNLQSLTATTIYNTGSEYKGITTITTNTTLNNTHNVILVNSTGSTTIILPSVSTISNIQYKIKNINTGAVTVSANTSNYIDSQTTQTINQWESMTINATNNNWYIT